MKGNDCIPPDEGDCVRCGQEWNDHFGWACDGVTDQKKSELPIGIQYQSRRMKAEAEEKTALRMTFPELKAFLLSYNVVPRVTITLDKFDRLLTAALATHGHDICAWLMDCFMPEGEAVEPGYEDSCSHYYFEPQSWEELERDWEK